MERRVIAVVIVLYALAVGGASAHPSSGIIVDQNGRVWFTDNGGDGFLWSISSESILTVIQKGRLQGLHWLALAEKGRYSGDDLVKLHVGRVSLPGSTSTLLQTDRSPIVVDREGMLYFAEGNVEIARLQPGGMMEVLGPTPKEVTDKFGGWVTGLATGPDGSVYAACTSAVLKISSGGVVTMVADSIALCEVATDLLADAEDRKPFLGGLTVDALGTVYAAAAGYRCVLRITAVGEIERVLEAERPWLPTGIAAHGQDVYVLEYANADREYEEWLPRVRKLGRDGTITTIVSISKKDRER